MSDIFRKAVMAACLTSYMALSVPGYASDYVSTSVRDYWLPEEINKSGVAESFQKIVSGHSQPVHELDQKTVNIALIYPSQDVSDFWVRNYRALTGRLNELGIHYRITEFSSSQIQHNLQSIQVEEVIGRANEFDFVIFGPTELKIQEQNIQKLSASDEFRTLIWAFHTPRKSWQDTPDAWFDFSSARGAETLCHYMIETLGRDVDFALNRGIPGITDDQRSGIFSECVRTEGDWFNTYEHFGQYQPEGGADGARLVLKNFPETQVLHNANTAMAMGALEVIRQLPEQPELKLTGWGGTQKELEQVLSGHLFATPMRMGDDVGVATAEAVKYYMLGQEQQVPRVYLGRITVASSLMEPDQIIGLEREAFRYSGTAPLER